jgi:hypothetical protein
MLEGYQFPIAYRDRVKAAKARIRAADKSLSTYLVSREHNHVRFKVLLKESRTANREYLELILNIAQMQPFIN